METLIFRGFFETKYQFKSYYVVWKPDFFYPRGNRAHAFKSYYVVWKLESVSTLMLYKIRLNRTM